MSKFNCSNCKNELIFSMQRPFYAQCGHIFCEQCFSKFYNPISKSISCPIHKKEFLFEFNKFLNYFDTLNNINHMSNDEKDTGLYCVRHNKKNLKFFCEKDSLFLCQNCIDEHDNNHNLVEFKLTKDNFWQEINIMKKNFENVKIKYLKEKSKINQDIFNAKKNLDEQIYKINNFFNDLTLIIKEKKEKILVNINNIEKMNLKNYENIDNIFSISDERCNFINNEFYYINDELFNKGMYETFYKTKKNFLKEIQNFSKYITKNLFNNKELINLNLINYIRPNNNFIEKESENIFGKIEEIKINFDNHKINNWEQKINFDNNNEKEIINKKEINENIPINKNISNNNLDSSLFDKKSNINDGDSYIDKQLIETGNTFYLLNKNDVKNIFKQQDLEQSQNDLIINKSKEKNYNSNYSKNNYLNNLNNINEIKKKNSLINNDLITNYNNYNSKNKNVKDDLNKKKPYKLLNIINNNKELNDNIKKKEKTKLKQINKPNKKSLIENMKEKSASYLISYNNRSIENNHNNFVMKSSDNRNKMGKERIKSNLKDLNNKRNNSIKKIFNIQNNIYKNNNNNNNNKRDISLNTKNNKEPVSFIYSSNNNSMMTNNLLHSYNKEYSNDYNIFNKNADIKSKKNFYNNFKNDSQILTEINDSNNIKYQLKNNKRNKILKSENRYEPDDKNKKKIHLKYSSKDINKRVIIRNENYKLNINNEYGLKRGRSTRQKINRFPEIEIAS